MHSVGWPGKIISFCGGVRFPKADLAQVLLGHCPAVWSINFFNGHR
jgi:hypothetical protein